MSNRVNKYLFDMKIAIESINKFVADIDLEEYKTNKLIQRRGQLSLGKRWSEMNGGRAGTTTSDSVFP